MQAEMPAPNAAWIGIDVSKDTLSAALLVPGQRKHAVRTFQRSREDVKKLIDWGHSLRPADPLRAVMEATGRYSAETFEWLTEVEAAIAPAIVNPCMAKNFARSLPERNKTDHSDARALAILGQERNPRPHQLQRPVLRELQEVVRHRQSLVEEQTRWKNRSEEPNQAPFVVKQCAKQLDSLATFIEDAEKELRRIVDSDPQLKKDVALMDTAPGVGFITAACLLGELGDLRRFRSGRELASFCGLSPRQYESGTSVHGRTRISKRGSPRVRAILYMSALTAARCNPTMKALFERIKAGDKKKGLKGMTAVMRKQLLLLRALLVKNQPHKTPELLAAEKVKNPVDKH